MIKHCTLLDHAGWLPLRIALWPDSAPDNEHDKQTLLNAPERYRVLIFTHENGDALGFAEASIRTDYVNGTHSSPVAFLEGLYVLPRHRAATRRERSTMGRRERLYRTGFRCTAG